MDLVALAREATGQLSAQAKARDVCLQVEAEPGIPRALADGDRIQQVLVNLLDNAIKYSRPSGTVMVRVDSAGARGVRIRVEDQGIGIPAEELARIGERFYRADRARSRAEGGSGLGLAIATSLVEAHGGQLSLQSVEGEGTATAFWLPTA